MRISLTSSYLLLFFSVYNATCIYRTVYKRIVFLRTEYATYSFFLENGNRCCSRGGVVLYDPFYSEIYHDFRAQCHGCMPRDGSKSQTIFGPISHTYFQGVSQPMVDTVQQGTSNSPSCSHPFNNYHHDLYKPSDEMREKGVFSASINIQLHSIKSVFTWYSGSVPVVSYCRWRT